MGGIDLAALNRYLADRTYVAGYAPPASLVLPRPAFGAAPLTRLSYFRCQAHTVASRCGDV